MQCSALYAGVQRRPRRLYTGMSTADVPMCADVVFVVTRDQTLCNTATSSGTSQLKIVTTK